MNSEAKSEGPELDVSPPSSLARHRAPGRGGGFSTLLLTAVIVLQAVVLYVVLSGGHGAPGRATNENGGGAPDAVKAQALRLEEMGVADEAARAWERYLASGAGGNEAARALIRYRIGRLYQEAGRHGEALAAFVLAEKEGLADADARRAIGPRVVDCLRAIGHYGAISRELRKRVGGEDDQDRSPVVASFAGEKLTRAQFDRILEKEIEAGLRQYAGRLGPEALARERERLAKMYRAPDQARRLLEGVVLQQLMVRRARELELDRTDAFKDELKETEGLLLARALREREVQAGVKPTETDIQAYYATHKDTYRTPERARLSVIQVESVEAGTTELAIIKTAGDFANTARKLSLHAASKARGGVVEEPLTRGQGWPPFGYSAKLEAAVFKASEGTILDQPFEVGGKVLLVKVDKKIASEVPSLEEVRDRVRRDYTAQKQRELFEALNRDLQRRYDVRFNFDGLKTDAGSTGAPVKNEKIGKPDAASGTDSPGENDNDNKKDKD
jgi:parvulin-like peptidyl-prolyl isomerase